MNHVTQALSSADTSNFSTGNQQILLYQEIQYRLYFDEKFLFFLTFLESWKIDLIKEVTILMVPANAATPSLLKVKVF